jgi:hypothetical protein
MHSCIKHGGRAALLCRMAAFAGVLCGCISLRYVRMWLMAIIFSSLQAQHMIGLKLTGSLGMDI